MTNALPLGTKLIIPFPLPESAFEGEYNEDYRHEIIFMPGITGTVTCYIVSSKEECGTVYYEISPFRTMDRKILGGNTPVWEWLEEMRNDPRRTEGLRQHVNAIWFKDHLIQGELSHEFLAQFVAQEG